MDEPIADAARGILDGHMVLSRDLAAKNHYPCIDINQSVSRLFSGICSSEQKLAAGKLREVLARYAEAEDLINIGAYAKGSNPKIDYAIWLQFGTCPDELKRILSIHDFKTERQSTKGWNTDGPLANENWFKPETLGDTILVFKYSKDQYGNGQIIYSSLDSTKVFCIDTYD